MQMQFLEAFPRVIGYIGGTHIPITASLHNEELLIKEKSSVLTAYINL